MLNGQDYEDARRYVQTLRENGGLVNAVATGQVAKAIESAYLKGVYNEKQRRQREWDALLSRPASP